jgi:phage virion morphogenesis protein
MSVAIELDLASVRRAASLLSDVDLEAVADQIGSLLITSTAERIDTEKADPEGAPWQRWSDAYSRRRKGHHSLLSSSGDLRDSLNAYVTGSGEDISVIVGASRVYAATHQLGDQPRGIPARPYLGLSADDRTRIEALVAGAFDEQIGG